MPASDMDKAMQLKNQMIDDGIDYLTWNRDDLKEFFEIGRLEDGRVERIVQACRDAGLIIHPAPLQTQYTTRIYLVSSPVGSLLSSILSPGENTNNDDVFVTVVKNINGPSPRDIFRKIRDIFEEEGWITLLKKKQR